MNIAAIIHLYNAMVLPNLLYCSQIWSPFTNVLINMLESIQHKFIHYLCFKIGRPISRLEHDYTIPATEFNITTIKSLDYYHDCILTYKILNNYLSCSSINNLFIIRRLNYDLRNHRPLKEGESSSNYGFYSTLNRLKRS